MSDIILRAIESSINYPTYKKLTADLVKDGKTTGPNQTEALIGYTKLNAVRMKRLDKTYQPSQQAKELIKALDSPEIWLIITEAWCGDAAQNIPVIAKLADLNEQIDLRLVMRDENTILMDHFLTNGARGIPKLIRLNANLDVLNTWGPRPTRLQNIVMAEKSSPTMPYALFSQKTQLWYNENKGKDLEKEIVEMVGNEVSI